MLPPAESCGLLISRDHGVQCYPHPFTKLAPASHPIYQQRLGLRGESGVPAFEVPSISLLRYIVATNGPFSWSPKNSMSSLYGTIQNIVIANLVLSK